MTECTQSTFGFAAHFSRQIVARFDGGTITTDGGGLLLRETDRRLNLLPRLAECFLDGRSPVLVEHSRGTDGVSAGLRAGAGLRRSERSRATAAGPGAAVLAARRNVETAAGWQEHA